MPTTKAHPSNTYQKRGIIGVDSDGVPEYEWAAVICGDHVAGKGVVFCDDHELELAKRYPQGWVDHPGDVCKHGKYLGGSGYDKMCQYCEDGE